MRERERGIEHKYYSTTITITTAKTHLFYFIFKENFHQNKLLSAICNKLNFSYIFFFMFFFLNVWFSFFFFMIESNNTNKKV